MNNSRNIQIITTDGHTQLVLKDVQVEQSDIYTCRAENDYGCAQYVCHLIVGEYLNFRHKVIYQLGDSCIPTTISGVEADVASDIIQQIHTVVEIAKRSEKQSTEVLIAADAYDFATFGFRQQPHTSSESSFELVSPSSGLQDSTTLASTTPEITTPFKFEETEGFVEIDQRELDIRSVSSTETEPTVLEKVSQREQQALEAPETPIIKQATRSGREQKDEQQQQQTSSEDFKLQNDFELIPPGIGDQKQQQQESVVAILNTQAEVNIQIEIEPSSLTSSLSDAGQPPTFRLGLSPSIFRCGRPAQLKCIVTGLPTPEVRWFVDGDPIVTEP